LTTAIEIDPVYEQAIISRAKIFLSQKKYDEAIKDFNRYIDLNKKNSTAFQGRAKAQQNINKLQ
jgi:Tfp pilus assembly protein PilF